MKAVAELLRLLTERFPAPPKARHCVMLCDREPDAFAVYLAHNGQWWQFDLTPADLDRPPAELADEISSMMAKNASAAPSEG